MLTSERDGVEIASFDRSTEALVSRLAQRIDRELLQMEEALGPEADATDFAAIREQALPRLERLKRLVQEQQINPWREVRLCPDEAEPSQPRKGERALRLGFFPTAANPLHWMHLIGGLAAISDLRLDKLIYAIAGSDPRKSNLAPGTTRHLMAARVLKAFSPFLTCTPISLESSLPGEVNVFRLLQLNSQSKIHAFYIAGTDHYQRTDPVTGEPDTIQRLEEGIRGRLFGFDERKHALSVIFLDRGGPLHPVDTFLDVHWIDQLPLRMSSTCIRDALCGRGPAAALAGVPFTAFATIRALGLYDISSRFCAGDG